MKFYNQDLNNDIYKIKGYDSKITISRAVDFNFENPWAIDVEDNSYFYEEIDQRNADFSILWNLLQDKDNFNFIFKHNPTL